MDSILATLAIALVVAVAGSYLGSALWRKFRNGLYARSLAGEVPLEVPDLLVLRTTLSGPEETIRKSATDLLGGYHERAIKAQNRYHRELSAAVSATMLGFLGLSVALTVGGQGIEFFAALDMSCFGLAFFTFRRAVHANAVWMKARSRNELLRQWCVIDNLLIAPPHTPDVTSRFEDFRSRIDFALNTPSPAKKPNTSEKINAFWKVRRVELESLILAGPISVVRLATHFVKRAKTQAQWFKRSRSQLEDQSRLKSLALLGTFALTFVLSIAKFAAISGALPKADAPERYLSLAILVLIGISSALTGLYLNQNARSLIHRYATQERQIHDWLTQYYVLLGEIGAASPANVPAASLHRLAALVLAFEDFMIEELLDWITISESDVIELSPS